VKAFSWCGFQKAVTSKSAANLKISNPATKPFDKNNTEIVNDGLATAPD